jgi:diguanylate cyclase (GGDEF)-like protein/PAS domain S-box-containing protein
VTSLLNLVILEDNPADAELMVRVLTEAGHVVKAKRVDNEHDFRAALEAGPDVVLSDYRMPRCDAVRALQVLKECAPQVPFIVVSGLIGEEKAAQVMQLGADDYLLKDRLARLPAAVDKAVLAATERVARRGAELQLAALQDRLESVVAAVPDVVWSIAVPSLEVLYISPAAAQVFGRQPNEFYENRKTWAALVHPDDRQRMEAAWHDRRAVAYESEYRIVQPSGEVRWIQGRGRFVADANGKLVRADGISRDITELVQLNVTLREREAGLRRAQLMAKLAHVVTGLDGAFESWSETLPALAGVDTERLPRTTRAWLQLLHRQDRDRFRKASIEAAKTRQRTEVEYRLLRVGDVPVFVRQTMEPLAVEPDKQGRMRWFNTLQDITESKLAEERITRLNRVYAVLSGINAAIVRIRSEPDLLNEACRVAVEEGRFVMAWIGLVDTETHLVRPVAERGKDVRQFLERAPLAVPETQPRGQGLAIRVVRDKAPFISNDVKHDPQVLMRVQLEERGINSLAILPIMQDGQSVGVLALYAADIGFFDQDEMRLLTELAGDVSYALDHISKTRKLDYLSYYDQLTGLPNRALFHERLKLQLEDAARKNERVALKIVDIERFKTINDTMGRQAGDALLAEVAKRVQKGTPATRWFARLEADHFAVVMPGLSGAAEVARQTEQRFAEVFGVPFAVGKDELRIGARMGIALFPDDAAEADALLRNAEAALKKAKKMGERYLFYTEEMTARTAEKLSLESRLRQALEKDQFTLHYQPKYEADGKTMAGMEALIRWQSPELGLVPPLHFIPLLEETGLILDVGIWVLQQAARDHRAWVEQGLNPPRIAVNVSAIQLRRHDFVETVKRAIDECAATGIDLEITESLVMEDIHASIDKLNAVRRLGIRIAIDDFGTGYSSLFYLARLPVQSLKIDRSFLVGMIGDQTAMTLVKTIISLAHSLHLEVVAEGVETQAQAAVLRTLGCDQMQGYLFSRPLTSAQMKRLLTGDVRSAAVPDAASSSEPRAQGVRRPRVLLADDERDMVLTLAELLRHEGYETRAVFKGADVVPAMEDFDPDVVLIDIAMPDQSGWDIARQIRTKRGPERPTLIAISGMYRQAADQMLGRLGGFNYYLVKPCDPSVLFALLRRNVR